MRRTMPLLACGLLAVTGAMAAPAAAAPATEAQPPESRFQKVVLNDRPGEPMSLAVLPDLRVLHTARTGEVRIHNPRTGLNTLAAEVPVYQHDEEGLQGIAIDPNFSSNRWVYLYYSPELDTPEDNPATPEVNEGDAPAEGTEADWERFRGVLRLSRFKLVGDELDLGTEQQIIDVPVDRGICCHVGGQIDFDGRGNLFLSTGDDTNPFFSDGYVPLDDRPGRNPAFDARRSSANTNDLRGKLLRIRVGEDGGYTVPRGNMFRPGTPQTRPEIYAMGLRNPFRFAVNRTNGDVYMADYSPDSPEANPARGPAGHGRWMIIRRPGNYGWPFCVTPDMPYIDYDFETGGSGEPFNCQAPVNDSRLNTGRRVLPAVVQSEVWYSYPEADAGLFPELFQNMGGDGIAPMAGPAYQFDRRSPSRVKWPQYYHGVPLFYEWSRDYIKEFRLNRPNGRTLADIRHVPVPVDNPMDMEFGPDGALYVLEYGDGFFAENPEAQLARIDYVRGNYTPVPVVTADVTQGLAPVTVNFSSAGTADPDGDPIAYAWDFNADGVVDSTEQNPTYTYTENGVFDATLRVTDRTGRTAAASVSIIVGNVAPVVELTTSPAPGEPFAFGQVVTFTVTITDDTPVDCSTVSVAYILGHDQHGHPLNSTAGCSGSIQTFVDSGHAGAGNLRAVFVASYTDAPTDPDVPPLTSDDEVVLTPTTP
ncbi:PQQ-dependent sugar dehydrogenase [Actinoplanes sp. NPDC051633]|uniref:PQQ-dependent sugar dehydrogenase n=1 Tax=Actinoplanes sp. NPDC051633 TaxID=3155670 RepID=UPI0034465267